MPLLSAADLKQAVADSMQLPTVTALSPRWDRICQMAVDDAAKDIFNLLAGQGHTADQINAWGRLTSVHRLQGLYWAFVHGVGMHNFDDRWVNKLDQRTALATMNVEGESGIIQAADSPTDIIYRRFDSTNDTWTRDTPI
jgi:hypothetical protein